MHIGKSGRAAGKLPRRYVCHHPRLLQRTAGQPRKKLIAAASAFYTPEPSADELATFGLTADDFEDEVIDIWPDIWPVWQVFRACSTQWRTGAGGATGLDYNVLPWLMKLHGVDNEAAALSDLRVMEQIALAIIHKQGGE